MSVSRGQYPALEQFMGGWFHQDWGDAGETVEEIVQDFRSVSTVEQIHQVCLEMDAFVAEHGADSDVAFRQLWKSIDPASLGLTAACLFKNIKRMLES